MRHWYNRREARKIDGGHCQSASCVGVNNETCSIQKHHIQFLRYEYRTVPGERYPGEPCDPVGGLTKSQAPWVARRALYLLT